MSPEQRRSTPRIEGNSRNAVAQRRQSSRLLLKPLPVAVALALLALHGEGVPDAAAAPTGGQVTAGAATINQSGATTVINQSTPRAALNWQSFSIGSAESVIFQQPSSSAVALNRIVGPNPSAIYGTLQANGHVFLINPSGVLFGRGANVDVAGLVASTLNITNNDFMAGRYVFSGGAGAGAVINHGTLRAANGGYVALIGNQVTNTGTIVASNGSVALGAGDSMLLDFNGDGLLNLKVNAAAANARIDHTGQIQADGGRVIMNASAKNALLSTVLNVEGMVAARGIVEREGHIYLDGGRSGVTSVSGTLDASSASGKGGDIKVLGEYVGLFGHARLDASGASGGGAVLVGGDFQGKNADIQNAAATFVSRDAQVHADALNAGDGGRIIVWSDGSTRAYGTLSARGGANAGNGGLVETSGHYLDVAGVRVDTSARRGRVGTWLLDPFNVTVVHAVTTGTSPDGTFDSGNPNTWQPTDTATDSRVTDADINDKLLATSVTITTASPGGAGVNPGDITVNGDVVIQNDAGAVRTLTLAADASTGSITINSGAKIGIAASAGPLNVALTAGAAITSAGAITTRGGSVEATSGGALTIAGAINTTPSALGAGGGSVFLTAGDAINVNAGITTTGAASPGGGTGGAGGEVFVHHTNVVPGKAITLSAAINASGGNSSGGGDTSGPGGVVTIVNQSGNIDINSHVIATDGNTALGGSANNGGAIQLRTASTGNTIKQAATGSRLQTKRLAATIDGELLVDSMGDVLLRGDGTNYVRLMAGQVNDPGASFNFLNGFPLVVGSVTPAGTVVGTAGLVALSGITTANVDTSAVPNTPATSGSIVLETLTGSITINELVRTGDARSMAGSFLAQSGAITVTAGGNGEIVGRAAGATSLQTGNAQIVPDPILGGPFAGEQVTIGDITLSANKISAPGGIPLFVSLGVAGGGGPPFDETRTAGLLTATTDGVGADGDILLSGAALRTGTVKALGAGASINILSSPGQALTIAGPMSTADAPGGTSGSIQLGPDGNLVITDTVTTGNGRISGDINLLPNGDAQIFSQVKTGDAAFTNTPGADTVSSGRITVNPNVLSGTGRLITGSATLSGGVAAQGDSAQAGQIEITAAATVVGELFTTDPFAVRLGAVSADGADAIPAFLDVQTSGTSGIGAGGDIRITSDAPLRLRNISALGTGASINIGTTGASPLTALASITTPDNPAGNSGSITLSTADADVVFTSGPSVHTGNATVATTGGASVSSGAVAVTAGGSGKITGGVLLRTGDATVTGGVAGEEARVGDITVSALGVSIPGVADANSIDVLFGNPNADGGTYTPGRLNLESRGVGADGLIFVRRNVSLTLGTVSATGNGAAIDIATTAGDPVTLMGPVSTDGGNIVLGGGPILLGADIVVDTRGLSTTNAGGDVTFNATVDSESTARTLAVNSGGVTRFTAAVGNGLSPIVSVTTDAGGSTRIDGAIIKTTGDQTYNDLVTLGNPTTLNSTTGALTFNAGISAGANALTLTADLIDFNGGASSVSGTDALTLQPNAAGQSINIGGVADPALHLSDSDIAALGNGFTLISIGRSDSSSITTINADVTFKAPVEIRQPVAGAFPIGFIIVDGAITGTGNASVTLTGGQGIQLNRNITTAGGDILFNGNVFLGGADRVVDAGAGAISFLTKLDSTSGSSFGLTANSTGDTSFGAAVGSDTALSFLTTNAGGRTILSGGSVSTSGSQTYNDAVALSTNTTLAAGGDLKFASTLNGIFNLSTIADGTTTFGGEVGGIEPLASLTTDTFSGSGAVQINGGRVGTTGSQTYGNSTFPSPQDVTLGAPAELRVSVGTLTFSRLLTAGSHALTLTANSMTFNGGVDSVSGSGPITLQPAGDVVPLVLGGSSPNFGGPDGLNVLADGFSMITFGRSTATASTTVNAMNFLDPVTVRGGGVIVDGQILNFGDGASVTLTPTPGKTPATRIFLNSNIFTSDGAITFNAPVTLGGDPQLITTPCPCSPGADVTFASTIDGDVSGRTLGVTAGLGTVTFSGDIGAATRLGGISVQAGSTVFNAPTGALAFPSAQVLDVSDPTGFGATFFGPVTLAQNLRIEAGANSINFFDSAIDGAFSLAANTTGTTTFGGFVGGTPLTSLTTNAGGTTEVFGGGVTTSGAQTYNDAVILGDNATFTGAAVSFSSTIDGDSPGRTLGVTAAGGTVTFSGDIGAVNRLGALSVQAGSTVFNAPTASLAFPPAQVLDVSEPGLGVTITSPVTLAQNLRIEAGANPVSFPGSAINGAFSLAVNTTGTTTFGGFVGGTPLTSLTTNAGGTTRVNGGGVTTSGTQTYNDDVTLGDHATFTGTTATFSSTIQGGGFDLTLNLSGLTSVNSSTFANVRNFATGNGGVTTLSETITTTGSQTYDDAVMLGTASVTLTSTGNGAIGFSNTVDGVSNLRITTAGQTTFNGAVGDSTALNSLRTDGGGSTAINAPGSRGVTTTGAQTYEDAVTLGATVQVLRSTEAGAITFAGTVDGPGGLSVESGGATRFGGMVGGGTALASLTTNAGGATEVFGGGVTTNDGQIYGDDVTLGNHATFTGTTGTFSSTIQGGGFDLTLNFSGLTSVNGSTFSNVRNFATGNGGVTALSGTVTTSGSQTYDDDVTLGAATVLESTGSGAIAFNGTLNGARTLIVNTAGQTTFGGAVGGSSPLASLTTDAPGTTGISGGAVTTTGAQTFNDAVTLGAATTLGSTGSGAIVFGGTLNGAQALTVNTGGMTIFGGVVGGITPFASLATDAPGTTAINGAAVTTTGGQTYNDAVTLGAAATLASTGGGAVMFGGTLNGAQSLAVNSGGMTIFGGAVGGITPLASLATDAGGSLAINGGAVTTTGSQTYNEDATLGGATTLASTGSGAIVFNRTLNGAHALTVNTGGLTTFGGATALASILTDASGTTAVNGGAVTTSGAQTYNDAVTLGAPAILTSTANGAITFGGTLNGAHALTVNTSGATTFGGVVGGATALASLLTDAPGTTAINTASINTTGNQTFPGPVTVGANATLNSSAGSISFGGTLDADLAANLRTMAINAPTGSVTFGGNIGANQAFFDFDVTAGPNTIIFNAATGQTINVNAGGGNTLTFTGPVLLNQNVGFNTDGAADNSIVFNSGINSGAGANRTLSIVAGSGNLTLGGVGGSGPLGALNVAANRVTLNGNVALNGGGSLDFSNVTAVLLAPDVLIVMDAPGGSSNAGAINFNPATTIDAAGARSTLTLNPLADGGGADSAITLGVLGPNVTLVIIRRPVSPDTAFDSPLRSVLNELDDLEWMPEDEDDDLGRRRSRRAVQSGPSAAGAPAACTARNPTRLSCD